MYRCSINGPIWWIVLWPCHAPCFSTLSRFVFNRLLTSCQLETIRMSRVLLFLYLLQLKRKKKEKVRLELISVFFLSSFMAALYYRNYTYVIKLNIFYNTVKWTITSSLQLKRGDEFEVSYLCYSFLLVLIIDNRP